MWGYGPWGAPIWGFWWIFPLIGFSLLLVCVIAMLRATRGGRRFMCMGGHGSHRIGEGPESRGEGAERHEELEQLGTDPRGESSRASRGLTDHPVR